MRNICYSSTLSFVCQALFENFFVFFKSARRSLSSTFFRSSMAFVNQYGSNPLGVSESQPCYLSTSRTVCQELFSETFQVRHLSGSSCRSLAPTALTEYQIPAHLSTPFSKFFQEIQKFLICPRIQRNQGRKLKKSSVQTTAFVLYWNRTSIPRFSLKYERRKLEC